MMEVVSEAVTKPLLFKEEVDIMEEDEEEASSGAAALKTRKGKKKLDRHGHSHIGNGNGGGVSQEEEHKSLFFDPTKVPDLVIEETCIPKGKELEEQENVNAQEINHSPRSNGKLENGSQSNGSHEVSEGSETKIAYMFETNKNTYSRTSNGRMSTTNGDATEVEKDNEHVTEGKLNIQEYDLEKIIDEQETHDLYCPQCNSCITRRVILKKRKRTVRQTTRGETAKEPRITEPSPNAPAQTLPEESEHGSLDVFRCLSCFSFFIPTGCGLNIFRIFGTTNLNQEVQGQLPSNSGEMPQSEHCGSWLVSCFQSGDSPRKTDEDPAKAPSFSDAPNSSYTTTTTLVGASTSYVYDLGTIVKPAELKEPLTDGSSYQIQTTTTTDTRTTSSYTSSITGSIPTEETKVLTGWRIIEQIPSLEPAVEGMKDETHLPDKKDIQQMATSENGSFPNQTNAPSGFRPIPTDEDHLKLPIYDATENPADEPGAPRHIALPIPGAVTTENPTAPTPEQRDEWDILKAIVYGGLVESVMSLSVVSAAAASGTKTLDIFILGMANLIGGIPLIFHNISDLRNLGDVSENDERVGHYWLQLGRRSKFRLHMVLALLSYILFGLLPPVIYGFSFRVNDNRENKMMAVAAASLACIALLAIGKAHVKRPPRTYFKTLMYYLMIAVSASGLSYVTGVLITRLLTHFGLIDQGGSAAAAPPPPSLSFPYAVGAETSAWASF